MLVYQRVCTPNKIHMSHVLYPGTKLGNAYAGLTPLLPLCLRAHGFCLRGYLVLRWLALFRFLRHTLKSGPSFLNMNARV